MTQSKKNNDSITIVLDDSIDVGLGSSDTITIDLNNTYGTTTTHWDGNYITDTVYTVTDDTITISDGTFSIDTNSVDWLYNDKRIDPSEVEHMCKQYPSLEKVWRNFKSVYDMCKQDFEGKKKAGELDDDIPF